MSNTTPDKDELKTAELLMKLQLELEVKHGDGTGQTGSALMQTIEPYIKHLILALKKSDRHTTQQLKQFKQALEEQADDHHNGFGKCIPLSKLKSLRQQLAPPKLSKGEWIDGITELHHQD